MKILLTLIFICVYASNIVAQMMECGTPSSGGVATFSTGCTDWDEYNILNSMTSQTPIKTLRVTVHVFQKNDGTGNFANANWVNGAVNDCNNIWSSLDPAAYPTSSPHLVDCRIRLEVVETHVWQNTTMWEKSDISLTQGNALYQFVTNQPTVTYKTNSIHIFFPGKAYLNTNQQTPSAGYVPASGNNLYATILNTHINHLNDPVNF